MYVLTISKHEAVDNDILRVILQYNDPDNFTFAELL
jgi:hypothetical protein